MSEVTATILQPARHGFVIDLKHGARRCQVRVFEFEEQMVPGTDATCEMPVRLNEAEAQSRLRQAQELLRERIVDKVTLHHCEAFEHEGVYRGMQCACGVCSSTGDRATDERNMQQHLREVTA